MKYSIRAMPPRGAERRFRAGRAWGKEPTIVDVVEAPAPPREERDRNGRLVFVPSGEISFKDLAALQADGHFAVSPVGAADVGADDVAALKLHVIKLEEALVDARRELASYAEQLRTIRSASAKEAEAAGATVARLQHELADARAQLATAQLERAAPPASEAPPAKKAEKK